MRISRESLPKTAIELVAAGLALVLPLLFVRVSDAPGWTGRYALLGIEAAIGLPVAVALLRTPRRTPAVGALAFLAVAALSTLISDNAAMSFWGNEYWGTGLVFVMAGVGIWAIGTASGDRGAAAVTRALIFGALVNAVVALAQAPFDLSRLGLSTLGSQATGLFGQPAHLAAFLLGGLWLVADRAQNGSRGMAAAVVIVSAGLEISGERAPVVLSVLVVLAVTFRRPLVTKVMLVVLLLVGLLVGSFVGSLATTRSTATTRLATELNESPRVENYRSAIGAFIDRPLLGWGPGRYLAGTTTHRSKSLARANPLAYFVDAHDWPLQWLVTTGVLGFVALLTWLVPAARVARGPLAGFALCIGVIELIQPLDVGATMLALLALGAAGAGARPPPIVPGLVRLALLAGAGAMAVVVSLGASRAHTGNTADPSAAFRAAALLPSWPDRATDAARASLALEDGTATFRVDRAVRWARDATARDERDPRSWGDGGYFLLLANQLDEADQFFDRALSLDRYSSSALTGRGLVEIRRGHPDQAIAWLERARDIAPHDDFILHWIDIARNGPAAQQAVSPPSR